jgi:hypothetical protein
MPHILVRQRTLFESRRASEIVTGICGKLRRFRERNVTLSKADADLSANGASPSFACGESEDSRCSHGPQLGPPRVDTLNGQPIPT